MPSSTVEIAGHIIDSLILPKVLDIIINLGAEFEIVDVQIGQRRSDRSHARIKIEASNQALLDRVLTKIKEHGALPVEERDEAARLEPAPADGVFPDHFYATTNLPTSVRVNNTWIEVAFPEMDCGIRVDTLSTRAECIPIHLVRTGDFVVVGQRGVKVHPIERKVPREQFEFMSSSVSTEQPKGLLIREIAATLKNVKRERGRVLIVAGPGLVHTGAAPYLVKLIENGYVDVLFAGNGLAVHDIETALFGTSLGVYLEKNIRASEGHEHHLWAINAVRKVGGIKQAVDAGIIRSGIFYTCVKKGVEFVLAGSIRDDGPLPDVITDTLQAQDRMREIVRDGVGLALMMATTLHAIATGNLLPASVKTVCVDINPAVVTKLADRGTFQALGLVTDVEPFLRELCGHLDLPSPFPRPQRDS
jgi:lysine-ketoglutarate reductase/saccharopine dehydrogenase-like protein (TIGR00300 family)